MKTQSIVTNVVAFLLLIILLFILVFSISNKNTITNIKILCNKVEIGEKLQSDIFKDLFFYIDEYEIQNQNYGKVGTTKGTNCAIQLKNDIVVSKSLVVR